MKKILTNINYIIARVQLKQDTIRNVACFDVGKFLSLKEPATQEPILKHADVQIVPSQLKMNTARKEAPSHRYLYINPSI